MLVMNTFFKAKSENRWTWASPDGKTPNEIDYIIAIKKANVSNLHCLLKYVQAINAVPRFQYKFTHGISTYRPLFRLNCIHHNNLPSSSPYNRRVPRHDKKFR